MLNLGRFEINRTHAVEVDAPLVVIEAKLTDPRNGDIVPLRAGAKVRLVLEDGTRTAFSGETDEDGFVLFAVTEALQNVAVEIDFTGREFLDLDEQVFVPAAEVELLDKRMLVRMPDVWRSDLEPEVFDALKGRFADGRISHIEAGGQGNEVTPWEIRIDHAWQSLGVAFEHYDTEAHAVARLNRGGILEAFEGTTFAPSTLIGATSVAQDNIRPLRLFRRVPPDSVCLRLRLPDHTFVDLAESFGPKRTTTSSAPVPLSTQLQRYPLPSLWISRGQFVTTTGDDSKRTFEETAASALASSDTVVFDLDDVLLVDDEGTPIDIKNTLPVTVFGRDFAVKNPDPLHRERSNTTIESAHLRGRSHFYNETTAPDATTHPHRVTRVIRRGRKFYHLDGSRTTNGRVVGVRRAVREAHAIVRRPTKGLRGGFPCQAEIHYFPAVGHVDLDGKEHTLGVALVFLSLRLRKLTPKVTDNDLADVRRKLPDAAERWTGHPLAATFTGSSHDLPPVFLQTEGNAATKFVFHFPIIEKGRALANLFLFKTPPPPLPPTNKKGSGSIHGTHAGVFEMAIDVRDHFDSTSPTPVFREGGLSLGNLPSAHELGHLLGLPDEYLERISRRNDVDAPRFNQTILRTQYSYQDSSMMTTNRLPMLRHHWYLAHILMRGKDSRIPSGTPRIYSDTTSLPSSTADARVHHYRLPEKSRSPFEPHAEFQLDGGSKFKASLTLLGDDFALSSSRKGATAVLELGPKLYLRFPNRSSRTVPLKERGEELDKFAEALRSRFDGEQLALRRISGGDALTKEHLSIIHLLFAPRFSRLRFAEADLRIHYTRSTANSRFEEVSGRKIAITNKTKKAIVLRHLFGLDTHGVASIEVLDAAGASITFNFGGTDLPLSATSTDPPSKNKFVHAVKNTELRTVTPLPLSEIAKNIENALNDPDNDFSEFISAEATGARIEVRRRKDRRMVIRTSVASTYKITNELLDSFSATDLQPIAEFFSTQLGATYEVVKLP